MRLRLIVGGQKLEPDGPPDHEQLLGFFPSLPPLRAVLAEGKALMKRNKKAPISVHFKSIGRK